MTDGADDFPVVETDNVPGYVVYRDLGIVRAESIGNHWNHPPRFSTIDEPDPREVEQQSRIDDAIRRAIIKARTLGANAMVGLVLRMTESGTCIACGHAVILRPQSSPPGSRRW